jgi:DNA helicase-2/ATP-dependent DNA helicase PcrA
VLVDEYQDCTLEQHQLAVAIADVLPTVILGDPLQGIFRFAGPPVDWDDVRTRFDDLGELRIPHRWRNSNPELGEWLLDSRGRLLRGDEPDWASDIVVVGSTSRSGQVITCNRFRDVDSVVAIRKWQRDEQDVASRLGGAFSSMETIEARDIFLAADVFDSAAGNQLALEVIRFARICMTGVRAHLRAAEDRLETGIAPVARTGSANERAVQALAQVVSGGLEAVPAALREISDLKDVRIYRHELLEETVRAIRMRRRGSGRSLSELAWDLREEARRHGRAVPPRVVSRTLLVKGLEFDHAIVLDRGELNREELYVAITRPRRSLTVLR